MMKVTDKVLLETTKGNIVIGLYGEAVPATVANFLNYVKAGFYTKLLFHRVIEGFMIQGGGMIAGLFPKKEPYPPIKLEINPELKHEKYMVSMARTEDPNSATCQFFICTERCEELDNKYAVFGTVLEGQDVVDAIEKVDTKSVRHYDDVPVENIFINKAAKL